MNRLYVKEIAENIGGRLLGENLSITSVTTDSRVCGGETMFIGIKGEKADGNDFAEGFLQNGGACAVVEKKISVPEGKSAILVDDTRKAMRDIAEYYRTTLKTDVVAVTGSVGKTSTKDMLGSVISQGFKTRVTAGNFNNEIGVPLTVFSLDGSIEKAVIEMGMSDFGEISRLTKIAKPSVAVITNIGTAHIGILGSRENILKAKLEILEGLSENGVVILNGDDPYLLSAKDTIKHNMIFYGIENKKCDILGYSLLADESGTSFSVDINGIKHDFKINVAGKHHVYNALAAIACGLRFGMSPEKISNGVAGFKPTGMRQNVIQAGKIKIIEDCYNASANSMKSSLETLRTVCKNTKAVAVLGDILEQGEYAEKTHRQVGEYAAEYGIDVLVTVGKDAHFIAQSAKANGVNEIYEFESNSDAAKFLSSYLTDNDTVLLKASRGMHFEEISKELQNLLKGSN